MLLFSAFIYLLSAQPMEWFRFWMFFAISILVTIVGQSIGLMIGAWFDVVVSFFLFNAALLCKQKFNNFTNYRMAHFWHQHYPFQ